MVEEKGGGRNRGKQAFPKASRLRKRSEFQRLKAQGRRYPTRDLIFLWQEGPSDRTRLGVTVSKRVAKQAVWRNRIKRWIREAFRRLPNREDIQILDIAIIARSQVVQSNFQSLFSQIQSFWRNVGRKRGRTSGE